MPIKLPLDETTLISLLKNDSEYAFQLLFEHYHNLVYKVALLYVKSPTLAQDIVQDVFMKIWFQRKDLPNIISFESWIYTLSRNVTINCVKKLAHEYKAKTAFNNLQNGFDNSTDHKVRNSQYNALLQQAINELPEQQQKVYRLGKENGMSYEAIAHELSLSPLTVKTHMARALASIRSFLQKHDKEFIILFIIFLMK
ncbi:MAG TPA: RNA polymerase sigma-70 factor [Niastella sp.]